MHIKHTSPSLSYLSVDTSVNKYPTLTWLLTSLKKKNTHLYVTDALKRRHHACFLKHISFGYFEDIHSHIKSAQHRVLVQAGKHKDSEFIIQCLLRIILDRSVCRPCVSGHAVVSHTEFMCLTYKRQIVFCFSARDLLFWHNHPWKLPHTSWYSVPARPRPRSKIATLLK